MTQHQLNELRSHSSRVAPVLNRLPEEQIEAIHTSAVTYRPDGVMGKIRAFKAAVTPEEFETVVRTGWFGEVLEAWDDEQKLRNTERFVEELHRTLPVELAATIDEVSAFVELKKLEDDARLF